LQCVMCQTAAPDTKERAIQVNWNCPGCTYLNQATASVCEICRTPAPPPPKQEVKKPLPSDFGFPYSLEPRQPRRPDVGRMRFLILAAAAQDELNDVKDHIIRAYDEQFPASGTKKKLVVDVISCAHRSAGSVSLARMLEYDAIMTWSGSLPYRRDIQMGDLIADYVEAGGGVVVCALATNSVHNHYALRGRFLNGGLFPATPGPQATGSTNATLVIPAKDEKKNKHGKLQHPILSHVKRFNGGSASYHSLCTVSSGAKLIASWSDGAPFIVEKTAYSGKTPKGVKSPIIVCLNFFPASSRLPATSRLGGGAQYWDQTSDGHHLLLNALAYAGLNSSIRTKSSSSKSS